MEQTERHMEINVWQDARKCAAVINFTSCLLTLFVIFFSKSFYNTTHNCVVLFHLRVCQYDKGTFSQSLRQCRPVLFFVIFEIQDIQHNIVGLQ